jgi:hypothetical protein
LSINQQQRLVAVGPTQKNRRGGSRTSRCKFNARKQPQGIGDVDNTRRAETGTVQHRDVAHRRVDVFRHPRGGDNHAIQLAL